MDNAYKYTAFISYNSRDDRWAKWLQRELENYSLPSVLANDKGDIIKKVDNKKAFRVFRYVSDLVTTSLTQGLRKELEQSSFLIVICSPNSAHSEWVGKEIEYFSRINNKTKIIPFIVEGSAYSESADECFHPVLKALFPNRDLLGVQLADIGDDSYYLRKKKAVAKVVSLLVDTPDAYNFIWNRYHRRLRTQKSLRVGSALLVVVAILSTWLLSRSFDTIFRVEEVAPANSALPPLNNATINLLLDNESRSICLDSANTIPNIPHRFLNKPVHIQIEAPNFLPMDTIINLSRSMAFTMTRNPDVFGSIHFTLWDEEREITLPGKWIEIAGYRVVSNQDGKVSLNIPLERQKTYYPLLCELPLRDTILIMPHSKSTFIAIQ